MIRAIRRTTSLKLIGVLTVLWCLLIVIPTLAVDQGDSSGGGQGVPVGLASSVPSDGHQDFPVDGVIKLTFNKNVINLTVRENNQKCFALLTADGNKVPIEVIMADDQLYPEEKRNISIKPVQSLQPGTAYVLKISAALQGKNGTTLGNEVMVNFVTAGDATKPVDTTPVTNTEKDQSSSNLPASNKSEPTATEPEVAAPESSSQNAITTKTTEEKVQSAEDMSTAAEPVQSQPSFNKAYAAAVGIILLASLGYLYFRKKQ